MKILQTYDPATWAAFNARACAFVNRAFSQEQREILHSLAPTIGEAYEKWALDGHPHLPDYPYTAKYIEPPF